MTEKKRGIFTKLVEFGLDLAGLSGVNYIVPGQVREHAARGNQSPELVAGLIWVSEMMGRLLLANEVGLLGYIGVGALHFVLRNAIIMGTPALDGAKGALESVGILLK